MAAANLPEVGVAVRRGLAVTFPPPRTFVEQVPFPGDPPPPACRGRMPSIPPRLLWRSRDCDFSTWFSRLRARGPSGDLRVRRVCLLFVQHLIYAGSLPTGCRSIPYADALQFAQNRASLTTFCTLPTCYAPALPFHYCTRYRRFAYRARDAHLPCRPTWPPYHLPAVNAIPTPVGANAAFAAPVAGTYGATRARAPGGALATRSGRMPRLAMTPFAAFTLNCCGDERLGCSFFLPLAALLFAAAAVGRRWFHSAIVPAGAATFPPPPPFSLPTPPTVTPPPVAHDVVIPLYSPTVAWRIMVTDIVMSRNASYFDVMTTWWCRDYGVDCCSVVRRTAFDMTFFQ